MSFLYFAYGSNLNPEQMRFRCPDSRVLGPARLEGFELAFGGYTHRWEGAVATVRRAAGCSTWGALYQLSHDDLAALDRWESVPDAYVRIEAPVVLLGEAPRGLVSTITAEQVAAQVYRFASPRNAAPPSLRYRQIIEEAFRRHGFPLEALERALTTSEKERKESI